MSQDTHLFSVRRPRETLGAINYNSNIPQPASAMKRSSSSSGLRDSHIPYAAQHGRSQSSSRMSLAPSRPPQPSFQRSSSGNNLTEMGRSTLQRSSSSNLMGGRMSLAPGAMTPRTQPGSAMTQSLQRRSSVFSRPSSDKPTSHQSFFNQAPIPAGVPHDKRSLRDRSVQNKLAAELEEYLSQNGFSMETHHPLGPNTLKSPTGKDFNFIFQWLYRRIDPAYQFQKSIDNEVPAILKQLRYPFEKSITKSQLAAVGGNNWGNLLGMLHWLMQVAIMMERFAEERYDYACVEEGVDVSGDRIIFRFLSGAYPAWLACPPPTDELEELDGESEMHRAERMQRQSDLEAQKAVQPYINAMAAEFEKGNEQYIQELRLLEAENESLRNQIEELERNAPNLPQLEEHHKILKSDIVKFEEYNTSYGEKVKRHEQRNATLQKELEDWDNQLSDATQKKKELQQAIDHQGISMADIDRMNSERGRLTDGLEATRTRLEEMNQKTKEQELETSEKLTELEGLARQFNALCYDVGLRDEKFELVINVNDAPFSSSQLGASQRGRGDRLVGEGEDGYQASRILNLDLRNKVKVEIAALRKEINKRRNEAKDRDEDNRRLLFELSGAMDDKRHEVEALEHKVRSAEEEFERTRDNTTTAKINSDAQIEKMEKELAKMRAGLTESVQLMEQREMNTNIEYEQLNLRANTLREELHTETERMLNDVFKFKMHIQKSLEDYEDLVIEEAEQEAFAVDDRTEQQKEEEQ
ncbi:MAG: hypothetical protein LQ340_003262 [Diploschistes diacapsis]|nr:MAG: hypothetical protein LQ340_003262 [Diploschistes diacapsis]